MKTLGLKMMSLFFLMVGGTTLMGQDRQEVPGDFFSLEGALELFKKSASPEEFERLLNSPDSKVNDLDLNGDGEVDYVRVTDRNEGNVHLFIIQAVVSNTESQDVAVIELEKLANGKAVLQITGDADVYGMETIIEPTTEVRVNAGMSTARSVVNVWTWPSVQYVYSPYYTVWVSPWHWYMRPIWWSSWRPVTYYEYYSYWNPYRSYYSYCDWHRVSYAQHMYSPYRTYSPYYYNRHSTQIVYYRSNHHRDDHSNYQGYNHDHSTRTNYGDDRTNHSGNEGSNHRDNNVVTHTPTVRERTNSDHDVKERLTGYTRDERGTSFDKKQDVKERKIDYTRDERSASFERKPAVKRDVYTNRSSEVFNKPAVVERSSQSREERKPDFSNRSSEQRSERSATMNTNRSSQPRERSVERSSSDRGNSSNGGGERKSNGRGRTK